MLQPVIPTGPSEPSSRNQAGGPGLILNTSGTQFDAVWSTEQSEIQALVGEVTKAIGSPESAQVVFNVQNAVQGDLIKQYGNHNIGKAQHGGSGSIGGR